MKKSYHTTLLPIAVAVVLSVAVVHGQDQTAEDNPAPAEKGEASTPADPSPEPVVEKAQPSLPKTAVPAAPSDPADGIRLNFRGAPLEMVLNYLSEAAGFIIILETELKGKVDVWSNQPVTKEEAIDLLNTVLNKNGFAAIRNGRTLTIVKRDEAKTRDIPVRSGNNPVTIPRNDEVVTQIIPIRHANATLLMQNLRPLLPSDADMTANESANSLVITDKQSAVRRMAEIVRALDDSISSTSAIQVFELRYADAKSIATVIKELFQPAQQQNNNNNRGGNNPFANFGVGGGRGGNRGGGSGGGGAVAIRVVAVADERSNSVVISAPDDMMEGIKQMVQELDQSVTDISELRVFQLANSDPVEMADMFGQLFPNENATTSTGNQNQAFRFGPFPGGGGGGGRGAQTQQATSERMKKKGQVVVVPDQRTSSIIVSAASELMPQIAAMVEQLDSSPARKQKVFVYSLQNADPQQVQQILQDMFQRNTTSLNRNTANQNSALTSRIQANNQNISSGVQNGNTGFLSNGTGGGGPGGGQSFR